MGGWFALSAGSRQSPRDIEQRRTDRSDQAAMLIAEASPALELAFLARVAEDRGKNELNQAVNAFTITASIQSMVITDPQVRERVRNHYLLSFELDELASRPRDLSLYVPALRHPAAAMVDALDAHVDNRPLPAYQAPPVNDRQRLVAWRPDL